MRREPTPRSARASSIALGVGRCSLRDERRDHWKIVILPGFSRFRASITGSSPKSDAGRPAGLGRRLDSPRLSRPPEPTKAGRAQRLATLVSAAPERTADSEALLRLVSFMDLTSLSGTESLE